MSASDKFSTNFSQEVALALRDCLNLTLKTHSDDSSEDAKLSAWRSFETMALANPPEALAVMKSRAREFQQESQGELVELVASKALSLAPQDTELTLILANAYLKRGLHAATLQLLSDQNDDLGGEMLALRGKAAWLAGDKQLAKRAFYAVAAKPDDRSMPSLKAAAEFLREEGDRQGLRMLLESMSGHVGDDPEFCLWMGEWLILEEAYSEAQTWLSRGLGLASQASELYWQLWRVNFEISNPEEHKDYRRIVAGLHTNPFEDTIRDLEALLLKHPRFWEARFFLATSYRRVGRLSDAHRALLQVLESFDFPQAWLELGPLLGQLGQHQAALRACQRANQHFVGKNPLALSNMIAAHLALGAKDEARALYRILHEEHPRAPQVELLASHFSDQPEEKPKRRSGFRNLRNNFGRGG